MTKLLAFHYCSLSSSFILIYDDIAVGQCNKDIPLTNRNVNTFMAYSTIELVSFFFNSIYIYIFIDHNHKYDMRIQYELTRSVLYGCVD